MCLPALSVGLRLCPSQFGFDDQQELPFIILIKFYEFQSTSCRPANTQANFYCSMQKRQRLDAVQMLGIFWRYHSSQSDGSRPTCKFILHVSSCKLSWFPPSQAATLPSLKRLLHAPLSLAVFITFHNLDHSFRDLRTVRLFTFRFCSLGTISVRGHESYCGPFSNSVITTVWTRWPWKLPSYKQLSMPPASSPSVIASQYCSDRLYYHLNLVCTFRAVIFTRTSTLFGVVICSCPHSYTHLIVGSLEHRSALAINLSCSCT